jgi:hypothetical protein
MISPAERDLLEVMDEGQRAVDDLLGKVKDSSSLAPRLVLLRQLAALARGLWEGERAALARGESLSRSLWHRSRLPAHVRRIVGCTLGTNA